MQEKLLTFTFILIFTFGYVAIRAQKVLVCQDDSTKSANYTNECECQDKSFYNAFIGKCQNICDYYGNNICGEDSNAECALINDTSPKNFTCPCMTGFVRSETSDQNLCNDFDECSDPAFDKCTDPNEACVNLIGSYECVCKTNYTRDENGACREVDLCHLPNNPDECEQKCSYKDDPFSYSCDCYEEFTRKNNEVCEYNDGYESCVCESNSTVGICVMVTETNKTTCYPKYGYERVEITNETYIIKDIDECKNDSLHQCYTGQHCVNKMGTYACECDDDFELDEELKRCVRKECTDGSTLYNSECTELCGTEIGPNCPLETSCAVDDFNIPFCDCQLGCHLIGSGSDEDELYLYSLQFEVLNNRIHEKGAHSKYFITRAIDSIFGRGSTQITNISFVTGKIEMAVGLPEPFGNPVELKEAILRQCYSLSTIAVVERCILPNGLIIDMSSILAAVSYPCTAFESLCNHSNTKCFDRRNSPNIPQGSYECKCDSGYEKATDLSEFYCIDIDECKTSLNTCNPTSECINIDGSFLCGTSGNNTYEDLQEELEETQANLEDAEHKTKVVGGVLGALFGVSVILLIGSTAYIVSHHKS